MVWFPCPALPASQPQKDEQQHEEDEALCEEGNHADEVAWAAVFGVAVGIGVSKLTVLRLIASLTCIIFVPLVWMLLLKYHFAGLRNEMEECERRTRGVIAVVQKMHQTCFGRQLVNPRPPAGHLSPQQERDSDDDGPLQWLVDAKAVLGEALETLGRDLTRGKHQILPQRPSLSHLQDLASTLFSKRIPQLLRGAVCPATFGRLLVRAPILLLRVRCAVQKYKVCIREICTRVDLDCAAATAVCGKDGAESSLAAPRSTYMELRSSLSSVRLRLENITSRLFLCEKSLASRHLLRLVAGRLDGGGEAALACLQEVKNLLFMSPSKGSGGGSEQLALLLPKECDLANVCSLLETLEKRCLGKDDSASMEQRRFPEYESDSRGGDYALHEPSPSPPLSASTLLPLVFENESSSGDREAAEPDGPHNLASLRSKAIDIYSAVSFPSPPHQSAVASSDASSLDSLQESARRREMARTVVQELQTFGVYSLSSSRQERSVRVIDAAVSTDSPLQIEQAGYDFLARAQKRGQISMAGILQAALQAQREIRRPEDNFMPEENYEGGGKEEG